MAFSTGALDLMVSNSVAMMSFTNTFKRFSYAISEQHSLVGPVNFFYTYTAGLSNQFTDCIIFDQVCHAFLLVIPGWERSLSSVMLADYDGLMGMLCFTHPANGHDLL
jgi:hypothetical protein